MLEEDSINITPEVDDKAYRINVINSQQIKRQAYSGESEVPPALNDTEEHRFSELFGSYEMDDEMKALKEAIEAGRSTEACARKYLLQDGRLYYLSDIDEEVRPRLYIA